VAAVHLCDAQKKVAIEQGAAYSFNSVTETRNAVKDYNSHLRSHNDPELMEFEKTVSKFSDGSATAHFKDEGVVSKLI
jgi:hypothetical protein